MFTGPIEDRTAIRELHETYALGVLSRDPVLWGTTWDEDAVWTLIGHTVQGRAAIVALWTAAMAGFEAVSFLAVPAAITVTGDTASAITQTHEILREAGGRTRVTGGAYDDRLIRRDGRWLYAERRFRIVAEYGETA